MTIEAALAKSLLNKDVAIACIDKLGTATGCIYKPFSIILEAYAEKQAELIKADTDIFR